jgi:hypothetical protein
MKIRCLLARAAVTRERYYENNRSALKKDPQTLAGQFSIFEKALKFSV